MQQFLRTRKNAFQTKSPSHLACEICSRFHRKIDANILHSAC